MIGRALLLVALMALPFVSAAPEPTVADLRVTMAVDMAAFTEMMAPTEAGPAFPASHLAPAEGDGHMCHQAMPQGQPGEPVSHLEHHSPAGYPTLVFYDRQEEVACAEARYDVPLPDIDGAVREATTFTLDYVADRKVTRAGGNADTSVNQGVRFYTRGPDQAIGDADLKEFSCFGIIPTFQDSVPLVTPGQAVRLKFELARCAEPLGDQTLVLAFFFRDIAPTGNPGAVPPSMGQAFTAHVSDVRVTFEGTQIPLDLTVKDGLDPDEELVGYLQATVDVPEIAQGHRHEVSFGLSNVWGIHALYKLNDGQVTLIGTDRFRAQEEAGTLRFTLTQELLEAEGHGGYMILFSGPATGEVKAFRVPIVAVVLIAPLITGLVAQRNLNHLYRSSRGRLRGARLSLQGALVGAWALYVAVAVTLVVNSLGIGMAAWPVPPANRVAYGLLGATMVVMVVAGLLAKRREMALVLDDLSDLEKIQRELERSNRELEQFAYVASHDLKEPLRMVAGYTQLLEMRYGKKLDDQGREFLLFAAEGSKRLQHMVDDLLAYSRVRSDHAAFAEVDLGKVMAIVEGHLRGLLKERNVRLVYGELPTIHADQGQLVQLLLNLIQNAIKFSPQAEPLVEVTAKQDADGCRISVRDEGIGIEPAQQERIFQIFQRLHLREEYEGNGIGLAMCKKISEQLGGGINVKSAPGTGSTFTVTLPDLRPRTPRASRVPDSVRAVRPADSPA